MRFVDFYLAPYRPVLVAALVLVGMVLFWPVAFGQAQPGSPPGLNVPGLPGIPGLPGTTPQRPEEKPVAPIVPNYLELSSDDSLAKQAANVQRMLKEGNFTAVANGQDVLRDYYEKYFFPSWTKAANRSKLQQLRSQLIVTELGNYARSGGPPRDALVQIAFNTLSSYVKNDQLDPAVRVSALLAIGELNERERPTGGGMQPPVPLASALPVLVSVLKDPQQPDALRLAALVGVERHCAAGIADTNFRDTEVIPLLAQIAADKNVPAGKDAKVCEWFRVRAIDVLAITGQGGPNGQYIQMVLGFVVDDQESPKVRLAASKALGSFDYSQVQGLNLLTIPQGLGKMVLELCVADIQTASQSGNLSKLEPRQLALYVGSAQQGMRGVRSAFAGKPEDQLVGKLNRSLDEVTKALTDSANARNPSMELVRLLPPALNNLNTALQDFANAIPSTPPAAGGNAQNSSP